MTDKIQARAHSGAWMTHIELGFFSGNAFAEPLTFKVRDEGAFIQPALRIGRDEAQVLMDDLWFAGLRPTEGTGSAGALAAVQSHLQDMRKIAFKKLGIGQ
jgi:hypothetical protein